MPAKTKSNKAGNTKVAPALLDMLVCPLTKQPLVYDAKRKELISHGSQYAYPIRQGIPIMLPEEARPLEQKEK